MDSVTPLYILSLLLVMAGFAGILLPALPGVPLIFVGMLLAAWAGGFHAISVFTMIVLGLLTVFALGIDFAAGLLGARRVGASRLALWGAAFGTLVGVFLGIPGLIVGPFASALIGELLHGRNLSQASRVGSAPG